MNRDNYTLIKQKCKGRKKLFFVFHSFFAMFHVKNRWISPFL